MKLTIQLPEKLEAALKAQAEAQGVSLAGYVQGVLERELDASVSDPTPGVPFKTGRGLLAKYGAAPSAEEIDANRAEMFQHSRKSNDCRGGPYAHGPIESPARH